MQVDSNLESLLELLDEGTIENFVVDFVEETLLLEVEIVDWKLGSSPFGSNRKVEVRFEGVTAFHYLTNGDAERRFNRGSWEYGDYVELSVISFQTVGSIRFVAKATSWTVKLEWEPNIVIEIWSSTFYLKAQGITFNNVNFDLY